jgi:hypothetical protein
VALRQVGLDRRAASAYFFGPMDGTVLLFAFLWGCWVLAISVLIPIQLSAIRRELRGIAKHMGVQRELSRVEKYEAEQRAELEREIGGR